jgi:hypothetical protein
VIITAIIDSRRNVGAVLESRFGLKLPDTR